MEEKEEKVLNLLETWMNQKRIPKHQQVQYYKKLISILESKKEILENLIIKISASLGFIGFGVGLLLPEEGEMDVYLGILFIAFGILFGLKNKQKKEEFNEFEEIEEERQMIKKWLQEKK